MVIEFDEKSTTVKPPLPDDASSFPVYSLFSFFVLTTSVELTKLIALHSSLGEYGGDLRTDTVTIIGATLDLQEKTTSQVRVFYLSTNQA